MERRQKFRQGLASLYLPFYDALCGILSEPWQPYCGLRTVEEQNALWALGRSKTGKIVTNAKGGSSPHNYGCASDWTIFEDGKPVWMDQHDPRWKEYADACEKTQAHWGGHFKSLLDFPHNELPIACAWSQVSIVLSKSGMRAAMEFIEERVSK